MAKARKTELDVDDIAPPSPAPVVEEVKEEVEVKVKEEKEPRPPIVIDKKRIIKLSKTLTELTRNKKNLIFFKVFINR